MKKAVAGILTVFLLCLSIPVGSASVTVYAPDGRTALISANEVEAYTAVGWYKTYEETRVTLYALDGRQITVFLADVPAFLAVGWYGTYAETVQTVYALDGRKLEVFKAAVPAYLSVGWYATREETVQTLYALDGRQLEVYKADVLAYLAVGWYASYEETIQVLYAAGNKTVTVYKNDVPTYLAEGWSTVPVPSPMIALTFDDGPHGVYTDTILNTLGAYGARATFFVLGCQAALYPAQLQRAYSLGCEIGSHTYSHPDLTASSAGKVTSEFSKTNDVVRSAIGTNPTLLRPPYGNHNASVRKSAGMPVALWNVDTQDWKNKNAHAVAQHVLTYASDGDIILMHDIYPTTAEAVKIIVPALLARGFQLVTVSELAAAKGVSLINGGTYYGF